MKFNRDNQEFYKVLANEVKNSVDNVVSVMYKPSGSDLVLVVRCYINSELKEISISLERYLCDEELNGDKVNEIVSDLKERVNILEHSIIDVYNFDDIRDKIAFTVTSTMDMEFLESVPHLEHLDIAIYFYVLLNIEGDIMLRTNITYSMLKLWHKSLSDILQCAVYNTEKLMPPKIIELADNNDDGYESEFFLYGVEPVEQKPVYVLTNEYTEQGAGVIFYPHMLERFANKVDDNLLLLATSVHEVVAIKESSVDKDQIICEIGKMLRDCDFSLNVHEYLSESIYYYDRFTDKLSYLERRLD